LRANSILFIILFITLFAVLPSGAGQDNIAQKRALSDTDLPIIHFFRKYISETDGNRCPMYPSCSQYAVNSIRKHGSITGWIMTCDRLMRCGRDELNLKAPVFIKNKRYCPDPVSNNDFWWQDLQEENPADTEIKPVPYQTPVFKGTVMK
jgi:uncharacterized protein